MGEIRKPVLDVLNGRRPERIPFWLMRQAGRYLPEYRALRSQSNGFLDMVYNPERACEITMQPLRRFGMDAAILFSDILVVPHALGQKVDFKAGEGPVLEPVSSLADISRLDLKILEDRASSVYETVSRVRDALETEGFLNTALIGFCGSPWTVACYMVEGSGSRDFEKARLWALRAPEQFQVLIDLLIESSCQYLSGQIRAGAEVVQLFESWAGILDSTEFQRWVIAPTMRIRKFLKENHPQIPVIGFPRGAGLSIVPYAKEIGIDALGLDSMTDSAWAHSILPAGLAVQGNLDPVRLLAGGVALDNGMEKIRLDFSHRPFIFNLGHGVIKETPVEHVGALAARVRGWMV